MLCPQEIAMIVQDQKIKVIQIIQNNGLNIINPLIMIEHIQKIKNEEFLFTITKIS